MIFKLQGSKCIFYETYDTPLVLDGFVISVRLLSISPFIKKSRFSKTSFQNLLFAFAIFILAYHLFIEDIKKPIMVNDLISCLNTLYAWSYTNISILNSKTTYELFLSKLKEKLYIKSGQAYYSTNSSLICNY